MFVTSQPLMVNFTVLNSMGVYGRITEIEWIENVNNDNDDTNIENEVHNNVNAHSNNNDSKSKDNGMKSLIEKEKSWTKVTFKSENSIGIVSSSIKSLFQNKRNNNTKSNENHIRSLGEKSTENIKTQNYKNDYNDIKQKDIKHEDRDRHEKRINEGNKRMVTLVGKVLTLRIQLNQIVFPFSGYLAISITVTNHKGKEKFNKMNRKYNKNENKYKNKQPNGTETEDYEADSAIEDENHSYSDIIDFIGDVNGRLMVTVETPGKSKFTSESFHSDKNQLEKREIDAYDNSKSKSRSRSNNGSGFSNNSNGDQTNILKHRILIDNNTVNKQNTSDSKNHNTSNAYLINGNISTNVSKSDQNDSDSSMNINSREYKTPERYSLQDTPEDILRKQKMIKKDKSYPRRSYYNPISDVQVSVASADVTIRVERTPPRSKRFLWDVYHDIGYPSAYVPRDDLSSSRFVTYLFCLCISNNLSVIRICGVLPLSLSLSLSLSTVLSLASSVDDEVPPFYFHLSTIDTASIY